MNNRRRQPRAFTLVELMISIALVVVLMLGITKVFSLTSQTAGANNQVSSAMRDARATQSTLYQDLNSAVTDEAPFMILRSIEQPAFRNKADRDGDRDFNPGANVATQLNQMLTVDVDGNNVEGEAGVNGEIIAPTTYNHRNHRLDIFSFFSRQRLQRQTGGNAAPNTNTPLISQMYGQEAWIWYGHLWLPNNSNAWPAPANAATPSATFPGLWDTTLSDPIQSNPNNYYASNWILGRFATLLQLPNADSSSANYGKIVDKSNTAQQFIVRDTASGNFPLSPLQAASYDSANAQTPSGTPTYQLERSRYDLAGTSIDTFRQVLQTYINANPGKRWWPKLMCGGINDEGSDYNVIQPNAGALTGCRFQASPFISSPVNPDNLSKQAPIFLRGCTQFMVEYAGDFMAQDTNPNSPTYGQVTNAYFNSDSTPNTPSTDGQVDFIVTWNDANHNHLIDATEQPSIKRQVRWYGMPRDADNIAGVTGFKGALTSNELGDVVPARDVLFSVQNSTAAYGSATTSASANVSASLKSAIAAKTIFSMPFERDVPKTPDSSGDYSNDSNYPVGENYTCAWGPNDPKPKMIRIIITIDDPAGKLPEGQTFEYVFTLP